MDQPVSVKELREVMESLGMRGEDAEAYREVVADNLSALQSLDAFPSPVVGIPERIWRWPTPEENPLNAWYVRTELNTQSEGRLAGRTVVVKDNLLLAGVPLMNGTRVLEGYTPEVDAEIVTRMLSEGATITGKSVCEAYCFSGGSHTSQSGAVLNPHRLTHSAGGSSSGSGALVAAGAVDMAIGCDQGGSIRMPASFCGIVGMKPTYGLVPYTGILGMNGNIDHTGPMTRDVADNALLLSVLAGPDGVDSRQNDVKVGDYLGALGRHDLTGVRIGLVREGFGLPGGEKDVDEKVRAAAKGLEALGAVVEEISIPMHLQSGVVTFGGLQMMVTSMFQLDGAVLDRPDVVPPEYIDRQRTWREQADDLPATLKTVLISAELTRRHHGYRYMARSMQCLSLLRGAYDSALERFDTLVMPTAPVKAMPLPGPEASPGEVVGSAFAPMMNTGAFNWSHHPAISVPCGLGDGLPIGMMLVGRHFEESLLYRVAHAFEQQDDWRER